jgi:diaminopimelate decarboxylase
MVDDLTACLRGVERAGGRVEALHAYPGTEVRSLRCLIRHAAILIELASRHGIGTLNLGGGFGYDYDSSNGEIGEMVDLQSYFASVAQILSRYPTVAREIAWEPGRIVFAGSGVFVTEVIEKRSRGPWSEDLYVDASFVQMPAPKLRGRRHLVVAFSPEGTRRAGSNIEARLCGATTLSTDELVPGPVIVPQVEVGDLLVILDVGAYGRSGAYNFLGKAKPPEALLTAERWELVRGRQDRLHLTEDLDIKVRAHSHE